MEEFPHLEKAPIAEASIQFGVVPREGITVEDLEQLKPELERKYGKLEDLFHWTGQIKLDVRTGTSTENVQNRYQAGYRTVSESDRLVSVTLDAITFHKLPAYSRWDDVFAEAWGLWERYREILRPVSVRRLGARYINRLSLPRPDKLSKYLKKSPIPKSGFATTGYLTKVNLKHNETRLYANLIEALEIPGESVLIILDNDIFSNESLQTTDDRRMRSIFADIHELKNKIFFDTITDAIVKHYQDGPSRA